MIVPVGFLALVIAYFENCSKLEYGGQAIAVGTLVLRGDGRLEIADEVPVAAQPPEAPIAVDTTDAPAAGAEPVPAPVLDLAPVYALDDLGVSVAITGLDCDGARWYARSLNAAFEPPEKALGYLELWEPRFLGEAFSEAYVSVIALYSPEEDADLIRLNLNGRRESRYTYCTVNLTTGAVTDNQIPGWDTVSTSLSEQEMLPAARALAELIQGASDHYAAATDVHEEGPLPFDKPMKLWFGSGAGGWCTILTLHPDGSFEGDYHDSDMGAGDMYVCLFHGRFEDITQASAASWTMTLKELVLDTGREVGEVWYEDGIRYTATSPYGFDGNDGQALEPGAQFIFYTPDAAGHAPGTELYGLYETADFWGWWPERHAFRSADDTLGCYGLRNVETGYGFFDLYVWGLL